MADYSSWKVADLKAELKKRGIPQTGLRLKQHFIDKLIEEDAKARSEGAAGPSSEAAEIDKQPEPTSDTAPRTHEPQPEQQQLEEPQQPEAPATHDEQPSQAVSTSDKAYEGKAHEDRVEKERGVIDGESPEDAKLAQAAPSEEVTKATAEPVEEALGDADEPAGEEIAKSTEKRELSALQTSETNTELSTPLPLEEAAEDTRKRKRRSQSPVPTPEAIANKKARAQEESPRVLLKDDKESVSLEGGAKDVTQEEKAPEAQKEGPAKQDARFRDLFAPAETAPFGAEDVTMEDADVEPALHPATASLYIDGLMRPLQPTALRNHIVSLASAPGAPLNTDAVLEFFLDSIKTHCFVSFSNVAAASRVRSALHGKTWPNERNRKKLRVDFVPDQHIQEWIHTEEASRDRAGPPVRWEVRYDSTDDGMIAILAEAGLNSRSAPSRPQEPAFNRTPPTGPRGSVAQAERRPSQAPPAPSSRPGQGFKPLDELFESTTAKPKLYYLPVPRRVADKRLDQFDDLLRKGPFPRRGGDEMRRITFEDDDYFVDVGPEYGARTLQRRQERGGRGGRGGRPGGPRRG